ncbi:hypothetical protein ACO2Q0_18395 [Phenylobacterium sp. VNQ135]|uniref:hypothetical protein n=1 Tax=Phenylobacterium sp. VNQ135 TaxID=3400922 RepID=UPI003C0E7D18
MSEQSSGCVTALVVVGALWGLSQCIGNTSNEPGESYSSAQAVDAASDAAADAVAGSTYSDQGMPYGCTDDCSGHGAGYEWAQENDITDPADCNGNSDSFVEGCEAFAEAYQAAYDDALEDGEDEE